MTDESKRRQAALAYMMVLVEEGAIRPGQAPRDMALAIGHAIVSDVLAFAGEALAARTGVQPAQLITFVRDLLARRAPVGQ